MKQLMNDVKGLALGEYERAANKWGKTHASPHEAYAVIFEEMQEMAVEADILNDALLCYWEAVKHNQPNEQKEALNVAFLRAMLGACELIQVAAMAHKALQGYPIPQQEEVL